MLRELSQYENLGTPQYFHELFQRLACAGQAWTEADIRQHFHNRMVDGFSVFDGCVRLATTVGALSLGANAIVQTNPRLEACLVSEPYFANKLLEMILVAAQTDDVFYEMFCAEHISYDVIYHYIQIDVAAFPLRYSNFRQLLVNFGFLYPHPDRNIRKWIVRPKHKRLFDLQLMPEIRRRKIGLGQLKDLLERKQQLGREAEQYVWELERVRLATHPRVGRVEIISDYDVAAGYDIVSFEEDASKEHDRFIEVKSYSGWPNFHWSRNEMDVARIKGDKYLLCLVDRDRMKDKSYLPLFIANPHASITDAGTGWDKRVEDYLITQA